MHSKGVQERVRESLTILQRKNMHKITQFVNHFNASFFFIIIICILYS